MKQRSLVGHLSAAGAYAIFGINIIFCKDIAASGLVSPLGVFTFRALGATFLFWLLSIFTPKETVDLKDLPKVAAASILGLYIPQVTFLAACNMTTAIDISIMSTLSPIFTMFIAAIVLKEPITAKKACGVAASFAGVIFLIFNSVISQNGVDHSRPLGIFLMLTNAFSFAAYLGIFRPLISEYNVVNFMKWMFLFSLVLSLPFTAKEIINIDYAAMSTDVALKLGFVIVFSTFVAYFLIPLSQKHIRPTLVSMYTYLQPMIAAGIAIASGRDVLSWQKILAAVLVIGGVVAVSRSRAASTK